jgi:hypothetical protein
LAIAIVVGLVTPGAEAADPVAGSQGTDTSLPLTDSAITVNGRGAYSNLAITVNQTQKLTNQAVSITWKGGTPTTRGVGRFEANYLQIMQCWGDDDGTNADNPGPPPEQCEFGAAGGTVNGLSTGLFAEGIAISRIISRSTWKNYNPAVGYLDTASTNVWRQFRTVDGAVVNSQTNPDYNPFQPENYWLNAYFNNITTNEIPGAVTGPDGRGAELFQVLTGAESSGLGCGRTVQPLPDGSKKAPKCWVVIVPRADQTTENVDTPFASFDNRVPVGTSPLAPAAWANRIAIPLGFNSADPPCAFAEVERRIAGSELITPAISSWQPTLCGANALPPFSFAPVADGSARALLASGVKGGPGMVVVSRPLSPAVVTPEKPVVYAPLTASGLVIGFNVERGDKIGSSEASKQLLGVRVAEMNLTPRLVAKLLTQSYSSQVGILSTPTYPWALKNPANLSLDPDFLQFNPEFRLLYVGENRTFSGLQLPQGNSDAALQIWEWIFADPEARAWLNGAADEWGMTVNPAYNAVASANSAGIAFGDPLPSSFPKADPYCFQAPPQGAGNNVIPPTVCGTDWMPYARGLAGAAQVARSASDGARISVNLLAESASAVWGRIAPQPIGQRAMLALTDSPSAAQYGLQMARLSRAGDNGADRSFIAADSAGLEAGVASMTARDVPAVLEPNPTADAPSAYPLTTLSYAAISPLALDAAERSDFASFLEYATAAGQTPGLDLGQLPRGYVPLPSGLQVQAAAASSAVRTLVAPTPTTTTTPSTTPAPPAPSPNQRPASRPSSGSPSNTGTTTPETTAPTESTPSAEATTTIAGPGDEADTPATTVPTVITPFVNLARSRFAVPGIGAMALASAVGVLEITKRPRRRSLDAPEHEAEIDGK